MRIIICRSCDLHKLFTCDLIWEKPASMHTTARHTFHRQTITACINSDTNGAENCTGCFAVACFWGLSDIHKSSGGLQMAPSPLDKQTAGCNSPHHWLMRLGMDLAVLCEVWRWKWHQWMPFGFFQCWRSLFPSLHGYPHPATLLKY